MFYRRITPWDDSVKFTCPSYYETVKRFCVSGFKVLERRPVRCGCCCHGCEHVNSCLGRCKEIPQ